MNLNSVESSQLLEKIHRALNLDPHATLRLVRVSPFDGTCVCEVRQKSCRTFVKVFRERENWERTIAMQNEVEGYGLPAPRVTAHGSLPGGGMWVQFADAGRTARVWSRHAVGCAMKTLAKIHDAPKAAFASCKRSHTPTFDEVHQQLHAYTVGHFQNMLGDFEVPMHLRPLIVRLFTVSKHWLHSFDGLQRVPSHGDYHGGNVLFTRNAVSPKIIDWEYAHPNIPYFDLFQFLDATSPFDALPLKGSRNFALTTYLSARLSPLESESRSRWMKGYYKFSILHLLWILTLVEKDLRKGTFQRDSLYRQIKETVHGILSLDRLLRKL